MYPTPPTGTTPSEKDILGYLLDYEVRIADAILGVAYGSKGAHIASDLGIVLSGDHRSDLVKIYSVLFIGGGRDIYTLGDNGEAFSYHLGYDEVERIVGESLAGTPRYEPPPRGVKRSTKGYEYPPMFDMFARLVSGNVADSFRTLINVSENYSMPGVIPALDEFTIDMLSRAFPDTDKDAISVYVIGHVSERYLTVLSPQYQAWDAITAKTAVLGALKRFGKN